MATSAPPRSPDAPLRDPAGRAPLPEEQDPDQPLPLVDLSRWHRESPPWLASALLHMLVVFFLGVAWMASTPEPPMLLDATYAEDIGEQLIEEPLDLDIEPLEVLDKQFNIVSPLPVVDDPIAAPQLTKLSPSPIKSFLTSPADSVGAALDGREPGMKAALLKAYGGTESTERAVHEGLKWLKRNQRSNGMWSLLGPYKNPGRYENQEAATAMALIAFQGAGYTHKDPPSGDFSRTVSRGWKKLLRSQRPDGRFWRRDDNSRLYSHAQCTIALCELYAMTKDPELREPAQSAVDYCVKIQSESGGWRYVPGEGADVSVTGWFVMALKSAQMAGLDVPSDTFFRVSKYLDSVALNGGSHYPYTRRGSATRSMTAEALLCRQYLGWPHKDERLRRGVDYLLDSLPEWKKNRGGNVYYWYYGTQVCHHMEGSDWERWNEVTRQLLPEKQVKKGKERGSWDTNADRVHGALGGRLYTTCLSIYILEVYYRHLPIYQQGMMNSY